MASATKVIRISDIVRDPELQPREVLNHDRVEQYAETMAAGIKFPPVVVYFDGDRYWLSQGFHRCESAEKVGIEEIASEIRKGTRADAVWDAAGSNKEHDNGGLYRSNADKRRAVRMALEARPGASDNAVAKQVGVHHNTVGDVRKTILLNPQDAPATRTVERNGTTYTMDTGNIGGAGKSNEPDGRIALDLFGEPVDLPKPKGKATFNQTNDMVDWARWTWNPVTGCKHSCAYCYARDIANRFYPEKFEPTFRPERLPAPQNTRAPTLLEDAGSIERVAWRNVFVCSMADLFGRWVPAEWIEKVFEACRRSPEWNYLFLTKFPNRYVDLDFPANSWVGTSVDEQSRVENAEKSFAKLKVDVRWLSVEPMQEPIRFKSLRMFDWVVIGGRSRSSELPEMHPDPHWVADLIDKAHAAGCKVYCKPNTDPGRHWASLFREYPRQFEAIEAAS